MTDRIYWRLTDMLRAIEEIHALLDGHQLSVLSENSATRAAFERFLEILSEASRHVPDEWKMDYDNIQWRQVADLGNFLRHAYHKTDLQILWSIYEDDLHTLQVAVEAMLVRCGTPNAETRN